MTKSDDALPGSGSRTTSPRNTVQRDAAAFAGAGSLGPVGEGSGLYRLLVQSVRDYAIFSNAVKFTPSGGKVVVTCSIADGTARIVVRDTGPGIPEDKQAAIFEPFVQLGRSLTSPHEGTGLGLAISRDLARAMGGDVSVESVVGEGSTFTLSLPRA